jgi:hypothetical protein
VTEEETKGKRTEEGKREEGKPEREVGEGGRNKRAVVA